MLRWEHLTEYSHVYAGAGGYGFVQPSPACRYEVNRKRFLRLARFWWPALDGNVRAKWNFAVLQASAVFANEAPSWNRVSSQHEKCIFPLYYENCRLQITYAREEWFSFRFTFISPQFRCHKAITWKMFIHIYQTKELMSSKLCPTMPWATAVLKELDYSKPYVPQMSRFQSSKNMQISVYYASKDY